MLLIRQVAVALTGLAACFALLSSSGAQAKCGKWNLMGGETKGNWLFGQSNGGDMRVTFQQKDTKLNGDAAGIIGKEQDHGEVHGSITGNHVEFSVGARLQLGMAAVYTGVINEHELSNGSLYGTLSGNGHLTGPLPRDVVTTWTWDTNIGRASCDFLLAPDAEINPMGQGGVGMGNAATGAFKDVVNPAPEPPTQGTTAASPTCTVLLDVEVYDKPDGAGTKIGELAGSQGKKMTRVYALAEPCRDSWCHLNGKGVPTGNGWVYSGPDYESLKCP